MQKAQNGLSPLDYLLSVVRDEKAAQRFRIDAAKAAAPYCMSKPHQPGPIISIDLPEIKSSGDLAVAYAGLIASVAAGKIDLAESKEVASLLDGYRRALETSELEHRIAALEAGA